MANAKKAKLVFLVGCLAAVSPTFAQCPTVFADWQKLSKSSLSDPKERLAQATVIQKRWLDCKLPTDTLFIRLLFYSGNQLLEQGLYGAAAKQFQQAANWTLSTPRNGLLSAQAYYLAGASYIYDSQAELATKLLEAAVQKAAQRHDSWKWSVNARLNLAYLNSSRGDYQKALAYVETGVLEASQLHNDALMAQLFREKANALYWLRQYDEAVISARETIRFAIKAQESNRAPYYLLLGDIESKRNQVDAAIAAYETAMRLSKEANDIAFQATVLNNLGFLYYSQKSYSKALRCYEEALTLEKGLPNRARLLDNVASVQWKTGQFEQALATYQQGLRAMLNYSIPQNDITRNPSAESIRLAFQKEYLLTLMQDKADTWLSYAEAAGNNRSHLQHALDTYRVADQMIDYMRWDQTAQESKLYWRQKTRGMYERAIETCYRLGDTNQAFRFFEKSRAVMLADKLNELGARQQLSPQLAAQEEKLRKAVLEQQAKLAEKKPNTTAYASTQSVLLARQDKLDNFHKQLERTNPAYYGYKYDSTVTSVADLQRYLKSQHASFVTYFEGDSALYVLGITADKVVLQRKPVNAYTQAVRPFMSLLADPDAMNRTANLARFTTLGNALYKQLLDPLKVPAGRVIISPDGSLIPFETLSRSANQPDYLVKSYAFSYAYSAHLLLRKETSPAQSAPFGTSDFLGVAPVSFAPRLGQVTLPGSDKALDPIAGRFSTSTLLTHESATRQAFQADVTAHRVVHLFTHATADTTDQEPTLYFADSTLRLSDLGDGALPNAQLVVLAACKTGIGAIQRGEGVFSLARGFSALGVPSVLTTLWSVQNDATYRLTDSFYAYLDQGLSKDVALQLAKKDWLAMADGANQLPNYWAGLILIGDTTPLDRPTRWPWLAGGAVLLLAAGGLGWRYRKRQPVPVLSLPRLS